MIVANFDHELWFQRAPLRGALRRPPARTARRVAGKAGRCDQRLEPRRQRRLLRLLDRGGKADMMQNSGFIIKAEQQRADDSAVSDLVGRVAKPAYHAVG